jgi:hypothetical protein
MSTMLSRSGRSDPGGKLTHRLDVPVSEQTEQDVAGMAWSLGMTKSELCRMFIERALYGEVECLRKANRAKTGSTWDEKGMGE